MFLLIPIYKLTVYLYKCIYFYFFLLKNFQVLNCYNFKIYKDYFVYANLYLFSQQQKITFRNKKLSLKISLIAIHENAFWNLKQLVNLDLKGNKISTLPQKVFYPLRKLSKLQLEGNKLKNLSMYLFKELNQLKELVISNNKYV